jgi:hypothetical protein
MTLPVDSAPYCERDDDRENCEIEITPEMIDAGLTALYAYNPDTSDGINTVREIISAALAIHFQHLR